MCSKHSLEFWGEGGVHPSPNGPWFHPDGTRKTCGKDQCTFKVASRGLCKHHYQNDHYEANRGLTKKSKNIKKVRYDGTPVLCSFQGCWGKVHASGLCPGHYEQKLAGESLRPLYRSVKCRVGTCDRTVAVRKNMTGLCSPHGALRTRFSLPVEQVVDLFRPEVRHCQNPGCSETENLHLDHDHACCPRDQNRKTRSYSCGVCVRGWLCRDCNIGLGLLRESREKLLGLAEYLERF